MGMTLVEKLMARCAGEKRVKPGDEVTLEADRFLLGESDFYDLVVATRKQGMDKPARADRMAVALDQYMGDPDEARMERMQVVREYTRKWNIRPYYELGRGGIEPVLYPDGGLARPGDLVVTRNSELLSCGALGALALRIGRDEMFAAAHTGKIRVEVPNTVRLVFKGTPDPWLRGKDLGLYAYGLLRDRELQGKTVEFTGELLLQMDVAERLALASFARNLGARNMLIEPDEKTCVFTRARSDQHFDAVENDRNALFSEIIELNVSGLKPQAASPFQEDPVFPASKSRDLRIRQVILGTGGNGRMEDLRTAAALLREYRVKGNVRIVVIPGSQQVYLHAMEEGLMQIFVRSGALVGPPSSRFADQCHRMGLAPGERCISTSARFYEATEIPDGAEIIYANPAVAVASAVLGCLAEPFEMMRTVKRKPTGLTG
jgi:3-isopropylmalate/(R)-2-methylmalate dehydratase large subunit